MNEGTYTIIRQYLGTELLKYSLNYNEEMEGVPFQNLNFSSDQLKALEALDAAIKKEGHDFIDKGGFGDGFGFSIPDLKSNLKIQNENIFNYCRKLCKGEFPKFSNVVNDPLLEFISNLAVEAYPIFLIKSSLGSQQPIRAVNANMKQWEEFVRLVKNDMLDTLTNKKSDTLEYSFAFETDNGFGFGSQVGGALSTIISRSFQNCCYKMKYDLKSFLEEIEMSINKLRSLSKGGEEKFSIFIGAPGLIIKDMKEIVFSDCIVRPIGSFKNPGKNINRIIATQGDNHLETGAIVEIIYSINKTFKSSRDGICSFSTELREHVEKCLERLKFSICFSLSDNYAFIPNYEENGFPLIEVGNYSFNDKITRKSVTIKRENIDEITKWYNQLISLGDDIERIRIPLTRLNYAIHERDNPEDGFIDALIAWEALF